MHNVKCSTGGRCSEHSDSARTETQAAVVLELPRMRQASVLTHVGLTRGRP
jgi:hypothetical protein